MNPVHPIKQKLFDLYYRNLNEKQREAVYCVNGPLLVLAGAGSGKTTVLVNRIAHIIRFGNAYHSEKEPSLSPSEIEVLKKIAEHPEAATREMLSPVLSMFAADPCPPFHILAITFTNKAAGEIKDRLQKTVGDDASDVWAGTFHSVCVRLLRQFSDYSSVNSDFVIYDQDDSKKIISDLLKAREIESDELTPKVVQSQISNAKNALMTPGDYAASAGFSQKKKIIAELFQAYQEELRRANALDFDDLLSETVRLLKENAEPLQWCRNKFRYILVDEYQDTNRAQYLIVKMISEGTGNIMVVGDDDQSIYKFRGAAVENILHFDRNFKETKVITLEQNYRSTQNILSAANAVIAHNESRKGKTLWCAGKVGNKIRLQALEDQEKEAIYLSEVIAEKVARGERRYGDFAILYRTKAQSNALETVFTKSGVPHRILSGLRFYEHAEIKDLIAYLRLIANPVDFVSLGRIINVPKRGIGASTMEKVARIASEENKTVYQVIQQSGRYEELKRSQAKFAEFSHLIDSLREYAADHLPSEIVRNVIQSSGYLDMLTGPENEEKRKNTDELISSAAFFESRSDAPDLSGFLEEIALLSDVDNYDSSSDAVVMMTMHAAKGLEFPVVFLPGLEENIFPSPKSVLEEDDLEEERRLFYVAMTRAKEELFITLCQHRLFYGKTSYNKPSRFVEELPEECISSDLSVLFQQKSRDLYDFNDSFESDRPYYAARIPRDSFRDRAFPFSPAKHKPKPEKPKKAEVFSPGARVRHKIFGAGTVLSAKSYASDTLYEIQFDTAGTKKLMATYANLEKETE